MDRIVIRRGLEFWLGALLTVGALGIVGYALFDADWRSQISEVGAAIAAFAVVGAALIAYDGALAKVRFDARVLAVQRQVNRRAFLVRTALACQALYAQCTGIERRIKAAQMNVSNSLSPYHPDEYALIEPPEVRDAWSELETLPDGCIREIRSIRVRIMELEQRLVALRKASRLDAISEGEVIRLLLDEIRKSAGAISELIANEVGKIG